MNNTQDIDHKVYKDTCFARLNVLKQAGFIEYWPPSYNCWYFRHETLGINIVFDWKTMLITFE